MRGPFPGTRRTIRCAWIGHAFSEIEVFNLVGYRGLHNGANFQECTGLIKEIMEICKTRYN